MSVKRKKRFWSAGEKRMIVAQCNVPGISVSQVARRYNVNTNLVFKWRRDHRLTAPGFPEAPSFLPVTLAQDADVITQEPGPSFNTQPGGRIVISLAGGHRLEISGAFDGNAVARLLKGLSS